MFSDLDEIEDKQDIVADIIQDVISAFSIGGKGKAIVAMTKRVNDIRDLSKVDWIRLKAEVAPIVGMSEKDLADIKRKPVVVVSKRGWESALDTNSKGDVAGGLKNCNIILSSHENLKSRIRWNAFLMRPVITGHVPFLKNIIIPNGGWIEIDEMVMPQLRSWLSMEFAEFGKECLADSISNVALQDQYNPITELLDRCADNWDGVKRADSWLIDLCGADDSAYVRAVGMKWLISAVARAYEPGCKVDTMLILESSQGKKKSSFLRELSFGYFLELLSDISKGKDVVDKMLGKWIIEMPELKALSGDREANKGFLTQQVDTERLSYAARSKIYPRRCVFIGTTNESSYLKDDTGERRYWPVNVTYCDIDKLKLCLCSLWGEAVIRYRSGEKWWLEDQSIIEDAEKATAEKSEVDEMDSEVNSFMDKKTSEGVSSLEIWTEVFGGKREGFNKPMQMRIASIMKRLGFNRARRENPWTR